MTESTRKKIGEMASAIVPVANPFFKNGILPLVIPIHITHISDMDGAGCAMLTVLLQKMHPEFSMPVLIPVGNSDIYKSINSVFTEVVTEEFFYELEYKIKQNTEENEIANKVEKVVFIPWLIVTDIATHSDDVKNAMEDFVLKMDDFKFEYRIWLIDHHITNGHHLEVIQNDRSTRCINFSKYIDICTKDFNIKDVIELGYGCEDSHSFHGSIYIKDFLSDKRDKSAMFIYFTMLIEEGLLPFRETKFMMQLMKFVYMVSCGDTYAFDFYDEYALWYPKYPRAYNSYFKFKKGGLSITSFAKLISQFMAKIYRWYTDGTNSENLISKDDFDETKYGPFFTDEDVNELDMLYDDEKRIYQASVYHAKYMEIDRYEKFLSSLNDIGFLRLLNDFGELLQIFESKDVRELDRVHRYAVFVVENGEDISMVGNTILKQTDGLDIALFLYPESRTLSFRANNNKVITVDDIATRFGGGGHPFAAGAKVTADIFIELLKLYWVLPPLGTQTSVMEDISKGIMHM